MREKIFKTAWIILKQGLVATLAAALKIAWKLVRMQYGRTVDITYVTSEGVVREAKVLQVSSLETVSRGFVKYVELIGDQYLWRSFRIDRIIL